MRRDFFTKSFMVIVCLFLLLYTYQSMLLSDKTQVSDTRALWKISVILVLVSVYSYLSIRLFRLFSIDSIISKIFGFWFIALLLESALIDTGLSLGINLTNSIIMLIPIPVFYYFFLVFKKGDILHFYLKIAAIFTMALVFFYYKEYNIINLIVEKEYASLNIAYYPLLMLPFVLLINNKYVRIIFVILIAVVVFSSMKRGGLLAFFLSIFIYFFVEYIIIKENRSIIMRLIYFALVLIFFLYAFFYFDKQKNSYFLTRVQMINEDEGSGRLPLYREVFNLIENSSYNEVLVGHGENAVLRYTHDFSAHNDFLEVFFDYGIIVFIGYIFLHFQLIKTIIKHVKQKSHFAAPFSVSYILFIVLSMISHVVIYPYFFILTAFWGMVLGTNERESQIEMQ